MTGPTDDLLSQIVSPLTNEPNLEPNLDELFDRDPTSLSTKNQDDILAAMLAGRDEWLAEEALAQMSGKKPRLAKGLQEGKLGSKLLKGVKKEEVDALDIEL